MATGKPLPFHVQSLELFFYRVPIKLKAPIIGFNSRIGMILIVGVVPSHACNSNEMHCPDR